MIELIEEAEPGGQQATSSSSDGLAATLIAALGERRVGNKSDPDFEAFLRKQSELVDLQKEHLHEQRAVVLARLRLGRFSDWMKALLQVMTALVGLAVVFALAVMAWEAREDHAIVIEPFSTPPAYAEQGLTGQALASELMDHLSAIVRIAQANSITSVNGVQADRDDEVKVEIPETGVSIGDINRLLRNWLGHERNVDGELRETENGRILLITRLGGQAYTASGSPPSLDQLEQQAAEQLFAAADPSNDAIYLASTKRQMQALEVIRKLAQSNPYWLSLWAALEDAVDPAQSLQLARQSVRVAPELWGSPDVLMTGEWRFGHDEAALAAARLLLKDLSRDSGNDLSKLTGSASNLLRTLAEILIANSNGAYAEAPPNPSRRYALQPDSETAAREHDLRRARDIIGQPIDSDAPDDARLAHARGMLALGSGDWAAAISDFRAAMDRDRAAHAGDPDPQGIAAFAEVAAINNAPPMAEALAQSGDYVGAASAIRTAPSDCYACLRERGRLAARRGNWSAADRWFADAVREGPSLPFADADWGEMLLRSGDPNGAIAKFKQAHNLGPDFADPLEFWGEALMLQNHSDRALAKFEEASKYAPNWGRLHLKWGEALVYTGKRNEAKAQFARAAQLDLTRSEKTELGGMNHG